MLTIAEITSAYDQLEFKRDRRRPPDAQRRSRFRSGWRDADRRADGYSQSTLAKLTWQNLGYRLGGRFGARPDSDVDFAFDTLAEHYVTPTAQAAPSPAQYAAAFRRVSGITDAQLEMLRLHYHAHDRTITATAMATAQGYHHYSVANSVYGRLGRLVGESLEYNPMKERLGTLVTFENRNNEWHWIMRPEVATALEELGWVDTANILLPEESEATTTLFEGAVYRVPVNVYERNPKARQLCLAEYGYDCVVCRFNFVARYGDVGREFIHVHHLTPVSDIGREYEIDPIRDLRPICPNCHAMIHRRIPAYTIDEVRAFLRCQNGDEQNDARERPASSNVNGKSITAAP
ncbi:MAG: HNH endonuclease [Pirellulaceae bacterium]